MRQLVTAIKLVIFLLLLSFAAKNSDPVTLRYYFGVVWEIPLSLAIFLSFALGLLVGLMAISPQILRMKRELSSLRKTQPQTSHK